MGDLEKAASVKLLLEDAIRIQIGSGAAASFGSLSDLISGKEPIHIFTGHTSWSKSAKSLGKTTVFDLASLTKILATTTLAMLKFETGELDLDQNLAVLLPERVKCNPTLAPITIRQLLSHTSGLPAWKPFYEELRKRFGEALPTVSTEQRKKMSLELLYQIHREAEPGEKVIYSDLGFLILEDLLSQNFKRDLEQIWASIPHCHLHFRPVVQSAQSERALLETRDESVMATEDCPWRGLLQGQVHDDNTWSFGGVAGHAGVFGTLDDVLAWVKFVFAGKLVSWNTLRVFFKEVNTPLAARRALGFDLPAANGLGSTGLSFSQNSVGHLGFSGTSLWIDLDRGVYAILLTNRVHPSRNDNRIRPLRQKFHDTVK